MSKINWMKMLSEAKNRRMRRVVIFFMVKLGANGLKPSDKVSLTRHIVQNMTGNANFPTPSPTMVQLTAAADALEAAQAALDGTKAKTLARNAAEEALMIKLRQIQGYVDSTASGNKEVILSSGMDFNDPRTTVGKLGPVTDLTAKLGEFPGSIDLRWKGFKKKVSYRIYASNSMFPIQEFQLVGETTKQKITISDLQSNQVYSFRITCLTTAGEGPESETISIRVY
jgi:hypothetical protein